MWNESTWSPPTCLTHSSSCWPSYLKPPETVHWRVTILLFLSMISINIAIPFINPPPPGYLWIFYQFPPLNKLSKGSGGSLFKLQIQDPGGWKGVDYLTVVEELPWLPSRKWAIGFTTCKHKVDLMAITFSWPSKNFEIIPGLVLDSCWS